MSVEQAKNYLEKAMEAWKAHRRCGVCLGFSPSWDGHNINPPCFGAVKELMEKALDELSDER